MNKLLATIKLSIFAIVLASILGILIGFTAVVKKGTWVDDLCRIISSLSFSMPTFWLGLLLMYIFALWLGWLPSIGGTDMRHLVLPALNLAIWASGWTGRVARAAMLDVLNNDHVTTARAKGVPHLLIIYRHVFRNALIPIVTTIGLQLGALLGGAFITETVFSYPGLGWLVVNGIFQRDYPVVQGGILLAGASFSVANVATDILYAYLDPRICYEEG
jgi:ABC-type dipeptide/oligopeptide/nickel transport system permease component